MEIQSFGKSVKGKDHRENEDSLLVNDEKRLYAVADGVTIPSGGRICAKKAVIYLEKFFKDNLWRAFLSTNKKIFRERSLHEHIGFSTLTAVHISTEEMTRAFFAHLGDSVAYMIKEGHIEKITVDHKFGGALYQAIGVRDVEPQFVEKNLKSKTFVLLMTDGISDVIKIKEIYDIVNEESNVVNIVERVVERAESKFSPYRDDKTIVCIKIVP